METAQLGCLTVSRLGYGCYAFGGAYGRRDPDVWSRALRLAMELGVNYFDTAESYGPAEEILGRELGARREQIVLATKVGLGPLGKPDLSAARVVAACEGSLRRLGTAWIDLYQVHFDDPHTPVAETVGALESLKWSFASSARSRPLRCAVRSRSPAGTGFLQLRSARPGAAC